MLAIRAIGKDIHLQPILRATTNVSRDGTLILLQITPHKGYITAMDGVVEELLGKACVGTLVFGHNQQSRGILIYAVDQTRTHIALLKHGQILQVVSECIDQRTAIITTSGVHDHTRLLIYDDEVIILIHHVERYIFGYDLYLTLGIGHNKRDAVLRLDLIAGLCRHAIDQYISAVGGCLYAVA